ncbi:hypothetical protein NDU88_000682 [Pleurodeles waltl]|uniref:Major facilitator superfamily (MFS) profile domain-containing protein n=3 Tax=Pleurodeles waltl TaxID=8319 RepID=A0AAV7RAQ0_PLEWA|nr:hypothetical protein NDU88_000682 [Pleurodeles waltl]
MKFEDLLLEVGGFGRFQIITLLLMAIFRVTPAFLYLLGNFVAVVPPHRCALQDLFGNLTEERLILINIPRELDGTFSSCKMYREAQWHILKNSTWGPPNASAMQICQNGWDYDHSQFSSTIATEWDLVCEQKWLNKASSTFFFIGVMVGSILIGYLSDRYGRRMMLLVTCVFTLLFGMASAASVNYPMFAVFRALSGLSVAGFSMITTALGLEWVNKKHRTFSGSWMTIYWSIGLMLLSLVAYLIRDWRWLLVAITCPYILGIISIW